jgi:hypothetical protein
MQKVLAGTLWRDQEGWLFLETSIGDRYRLVEPQTLTLAETREQVKTDELQDYHYGMVVVATCQLD